jgi:DNA-directed RNA polymerase subunit RPC12/RpoP
MSPLTLESELKRAAAEADWSRVVHRCAWCKRIADAHGHYVLALEPEESTVITDGMCPPCGTRALAKLTARRLADQPLAA